MGTDKWRGYREKVGQTLAEAGYSEASVAALIDLDGEMFRMMRSMVKGELPAQLMSELGAGLELAQFQALTAITRIQGGIGRSEQQEATIGLVAEEMNVDPSRASRIVADLIAAGHVRRDVSQSDGRKAVLTLTETATRAAGLSGPQLGPGQCVRLRRGMRSIRAVRDCRNAASRGKIASACTSRRLSDNSPEICRAEINAR